MMPEGTHLAEGEHFADERLDALVLEMLLDSDDFVPGNALCDKLDLPRTELLKRIDSLRARGYSIFASGGRGYRLAGLPGGLSERELSPLLHSADVGRRIHFLEEVASVGEEHLEKSAALRKLLHLGVQNYRLERAIRGLGERRFSLLKAAEEAGLTIWEVLEGGYEELGTVDEKLLAGRAKSCCTAAN